MLSALVRARGLGAASTASRAAVVVRDRRRGPISVVDCVSAAPCMLDRRSPAQCVISRRDASSRITDDTEPLQLNATYDAVVVGAGL